jgi:hypothetical protein
MRRPQEGGNLMHRLTFTAVALACLVALVLAGPAGFPWR